MPSCRTGSWWNGAAQLLGIQHARPSSRRSRAICRRRLDAKSRRCGAPAARGRHRGDPRRRLQPHLRGQTSWGRRCRCAGWTTPATTGCVPDNGVTTSTTPAAATRWTCTHPRVLQMVMDCAAILGRRVPRRWIPFRSRRHARPRGARLRSRLAASSTRCGRIRCCRKVKLISEPWDIGPGGYQVGKSSARLGRVERRASATACGGSGTATRRAPGAGAPPAGFGRLFDQRRRRPWAVGQFHHRA